MAQENVGDDVGAGYHLDNLYNKTDVKLLDCKRQVEATMKREAIALDIHAFLNHWLPFKDTHLGHFITGPDQLVHLPF